MVGYNIEPGYCGTHNKEDCWEAIVEAVKSINQKELMAEYKGPYFCEEGCCSAVEMATNMTTKQGSDMSVMIREDYIRLLASGGGVTRNIKECMRRAFIRCILRRTWAFNVDVTSG